jgi:acyl-CoA reductase-like NAD-dependent aldehyde dehydrogenase
MAARRKAGGSRAKTGGTRAKTSRGAARPRAAGAGAGAGQRSATARQRAGAARGVTRLPVAKTYKLYIDGKFPRSESGRYFELHVNGGALIANVCRSSRKDFRDALVAARAAFDKWSSSSAYLRGQILYRIAEMLEGRSEQFITELTLQGRTRREAEAEVSKSIDRLVYYAGWADKYQQVFSAVNPVSTSHFNFSVLEPTGVVAVIAPEASGLLGLVSNIAPAIAGGNTCVVLASESQPLSAVSLAEVLQSSDVPAGVVNVLTGHKSELIEQFASHMDVNAVIYCEGDAKATRQIGELAADNIKRVILRARIDWSADEAQSPYFISDTQETKTTWHPIGS